jgi:hypothetical protein
MISTTKVFAPQKAPYALLMVEANGGTVTVAYQAPDETWITAAVIDDDGVYELNLRNAPVRFTPAGGAEYAVA